jgi:hypothetical protein
MKIGKSTIVLYFLAVSIAMAKTHSAWQDPLILTRLFDTLSVIRFLLKDGLAAKAIPGHLSEVYRADTMKKTQVFQWVREIRAGREYLSDEARPCRPCQMNLNTVLAHKFEVAPHPTARKLSLSPGVSVQAMTNHLHHNLGMKWCHLRWIPHVLDDSQKAKRVHWAPVLFEALNVHGRTKYQYLITGDPW